MDKNTVTCVSSVIIADENQENDVILEVFISGRKWYFRMNFLTRSEIDGNATASADYSNFLVSSYSLLDFYIGLGLAISSSLFIALIKLAQVDCIQRASEGGFSYLREWLWWFGVLTMGAGEACNFAAYAFAPASLVTPLGVLSVIVTAILSSKLLKERLNLLGKIGCAVCLLGSTVIVLHSPKRRRIAVILASVIMIIYVAPRFGHANILVYIFICSIIGSLSVLSVKGLGLAIKETIGGKQQFTNFLTWFWLVAVILCISVQLIYLNKSLDIYNTSMVTPIYYVFFTTFVILASSILYKEWSRLGASDILGNVVGFSITIIGIFQMQLFRDVNITMRHLRMLIHKSSMNIDSLETSLVDDFSGIATNPQQIYT
ncbi:Magnesium transporter NIPA2 [Dirofilaria immitis]|nr:Magnesium transporter NIPA2 [Dirofilaria immitis]